MALVRAGAAPANPAGAPATGMPDAIPRDRWRRPLITPVDGGRPVGYTRASTLGGTLEDQYNLGQWRMRQVAFGISRRRDLLLSAQAVAGTAGKANKDALDDVAERALEAAESSAAATIGTALHALGERVDRGEDLSHVTGDARLALDAYASLMRHFRVHASEQFVVCDPLQTAGTFDRLVSPQGVMIAPDGTRLDASDRLILDLKTSGTAQFFGIKFAVQCAAYGYGTPYTHPAGRGEWPDGRAPNRSWALILHVPSGLTDPSEAGLHWVDLGVGWELAQLACTVRDWRKRKDLVRPADLPTIPEQLARTGLIAQLRQAPDRATLERLWSSHESVWSDDCTRMAKARLAELAA